MINCNPETFLLLFASRVTEFSHSAPAGDCLGQIQNYAIQDMNLASLEFAASVI